MRWMAVCGGVVLVIAAVSWGFAMRGSPEKGTMSETHYSMQEDTGFRITSAAFEDGGVIPSRYTCDGANVSPSVVFHGVPPGAKSLVIIADDPDVPRELGGGVFDHWILFNIPPTVTGIPEGGSAGIAGVNGGGERGYFGPCPPPRYEPHEHRYFFKAFALDTTLSLSDGASKAEVEAALIGHVLAESVLLGRYQRQ